MKYFIVLMMSCLTFSTFAEKLVTSNQNEQMQGKHLTSEQRVAMEKRVLERSGGFIEIPGKGQIVVYNYQSKISHELIEDRTKRFAGSIHSVITLASEKKSLDQGLPVLPQGISAGVFVVDRKDLPMSLLAVEDRWGLVNVAKLNPDNVDKAMFEKRFAKEFSRVLAITLGGYTSQTVNSSLQLVTSVKDIDSLAMEGAAFDTLQLIAKALKRLGVVAPRKITYRRACIEGIAPSPTNDYQKAVWEEFNTKPTAPIKIQYDSVKGE